MCANFGFGALGCISPCIPEKKAALASEEGPEIVLLCGADAATLEVTHHAARS
jgi:hypothetical protein